MFPGSAEPGCDKTDPWLSSLVFVSMPHDRAGQLCCQATLRVISR
jgi:hypothetical protein